MILLNGFEKPELYRGGFVSIGNFDGVHKGHQSMIAALVAHAHRESAPAVVLTFDPHPISLLRPGKVPPSLSTLERKSELLNRYGVDYVIAYPTDQALLELSADDFFKKILCEEMAAQGVVEGPNFFFGKDRSGDIHKLLELCQQHGLIFEIVPPYQIEDDLISSSRIRGLIQQGEMDSAVSMLGHAYRLRGTVVRGSDRGSGLGFPTANIQQIETIIPGEGVYGGRVSIEDKVYPAAINIGSNPTFSEAEHKIEAHIVGFTGDLYNQVLNVDFLSRIRDVTTFENIDQLKSQIEHDVQTVESLVKHSAYR